MGPQNLGQCAKGDVAIGELGLACERIDIGGPFGKNREPDYLAMNPNGLVPTLEEDGFHLWESNAIVRYLAAKFGAGALDPADARARAVAGQWMDWQLTMAGPAIFPVFWGLVRTPLEQRDPKAIDAGKAKTLEAMSILNAQLTKTAYVAGDAFSCGDIPVGIIVHRFVALVPDHPAMNGLERWYADLCERPAFRAHVTEIPLV
ncbi:MAG: glutathione S-transferase family protein [Rhodoplanes sp.]